MLSRHALRIASLAAAVLVVSACGRRPVTAAGPMYATRSIAIIGPMCEHQDRPYSDWICPDTAAARSSMFNPAEVDSLTLIVKLRDGRTITKSIPGSADAIFMSRAALENMLLRYYDATDPVKAAALRAFISRHFREGR